MRLTRPVHTPNSGRRRLSQVASIGATVVLVASGVLCLSAGCGGGSSPGASYAEYDCGGRIGKIIRDDCSKNAIKYDGTIFGSSVNTPVAGGSVSYRETATREASELVQLLNQ